ncbi:hypothetical protein L209DRAFT_752336 [Thermothelomyces heterothallicus CBS 203.75]
MRVPLFSAFALLSNLTGGELEIMTISRPAVSYRVPHPRSPKTPLFSNANLRPTFSLR